MKPKGKHPDKALSATKVRSLAKPGRYADGNGLYLVVDPSGAKRWVLRTVVHNRRRDIGLGGLRLVPLADAREKAIQYRKIAREGGDPLAVKRKAQMTIPIFADAAMLVHSERRMSWKNAKHAAQWISTLENYVFPMVGTHRIDQIETPDVLLVLSPIWLTKPETARRVKQRIGTVMDWAKAAGFRAGDNPVDGVLKGLSKQPDRVVHHAALPYAEIPAFILELSGSNVGEPTKFAFEFLILTAARTNEVLGSKWQEIDLDQAVWTVPAQRMKAAREHRVPLSERCVEILNYAKSFSVDSEYLFARQSPEKPMSNMVFLMALRRMRPGYTVHGFRSAFRDWAAERTNFPREVCEMALAHAIKDKAEAAYRRGDLLEKRRELMATWASFATTASADIVPLRTG